MDVKSIFKSAVPFLSAALQFVPGGGVIPQLAAKALSAVTKTDVKPETIEQTLTDLATTEDGRLKMRQAEQDYSKAMAELGFDHVEKILELENADRASARDREKTVKDKIPAILAIAVTLGFFGMLFLVAVRGIATGSDRVCDIMLGSLGTAWISIVAYYFGSSSGSDRKTELLAEAPAIEKK